MADFLSDRNVLVTGGCGFIGSHLVRRLTSLGARVTVIDNLAPRCGGKLQNLAGVLDRITLQQADLCNVAEYIELLPSVEFVFCLAGSTSHAESMRRPDDDLHANCRGPLALLESLRRASPEAKIVAAGTRQVYGRPLALPVDESHPLRPIDVNGVHMQAAENYYRVYHETYGLRSACLRLTNTYGPRMDLARCCHGFVSVFFRQALLGRSIDLYGGGAQRRDFNFVGDVVEAFLSAARLPMEEHQVYNVGHEEPSSVRAFAEQLCATIGGSIRSVPFPAERQRIDIGEYWAHCGKFRRATNWRPKTSLAEGIAITARHYLANHDELRNLDPPSGDAPPTSLMSSAF
jgi:nucleoside-diphosphate-sugar epimerase